MSRELKFRAWNKKDSEFITDYDTGEYADIEFCGSQVEVIQKDLCDTCASGEHEQYETWNRISENIEVMQYTGLKDREGVEIYEGDVITNGHLIGEVKFEREAFVCDSKNKDFQPEFMRYVPTESFNVIGNIYESPELIESES